MAPALSPQTEEGLKRGGGVHRFSFNPGDHMGGGGQELLVHVNVSLYSLSF